MEGNKLVIPALTKDDIEVRVNNTGKSTNGYYAVLLLYKNARVDMRILDQVFGIFGWQRKQDIVNGNLYCTVSLWDDTKKCWVDKQDVGTENKMQAEKSEASDAFKRACFNVGIGRELYTSPSIFVNLTNNDISTDKNGIINTDNKGNPKLNPKLKFSVGHIKYNDENGARTISELILVDQNGVERFRYPKYLKNTSNENKAKTNTTNNEQTITKEQSDTIKITVKTLLEKKPNYKTKFDVLEAETLGYTEMSVEKYNDVMSWINKKLDTTIQN